MTISPQFLTMAQIQSDISQGKWVDSNFLNTKINELQSKLYGPAVSIAARSQLTLENYVFASEDTKRELIQRFGLSEVISELGEDCLFHERVQHTALLILSNITLSSIALIKIGGITLNRNPLRWALMDSGWFCERSTKEMQMIEDLNLLYVRIKVITVNQPELWDWYLRKNERFIWGYKKKPF